MTVHGSFCGANIFFLLWKLVSTIGCLFFSGRSETPVAVQSGEELVTPFLLRTTSRAVRLESSGSQTRALTGGAGAPRAPGRALIHPTGRGLLARDSNLKGHRGLFFNVFKVLSGAPLEQNSILPRTAPQSLRRRDDLPRTENGASEKNAPRLPSLPSKLSTRHFGSV
jgi:hypothetical protein